ncbi:MAG TPA: hypothetical protein VM285_00470, partial [Polyangia bacterium]|nr:hypothetical protein [Polyangia bacterium]
ERAYDPLWRYVKRVDRLKYLGQGARVRFGEFELGLRSPHRVPSKVDFVEEVIFHGRKLVIPFTSVRGLLVAHGMLPDRRVPVFTVMIRVDGCDSYLPLHRCQLDSAATDLAEFLSSRLRVPLGIASRPLGFFVEPGAAALIHAGGEIPLYQLRTLISARGPDGLVRVSLLATDRRVDLVREPDPLGWYERWGIVAGDIVAILARRARARYGRE